MKKKKAVKKKKNNQWVPGYILDLVERSERNQGRKKKNHLF